jgi:hypothetical protein
VRELVGAVVGEEPGMMEDRGVDPGTEEAIDEVSAAELVVRT